MNVKILTLCVDILLIVYSHPTFAAIYINNPDIVHGNLIPRLKRLSNTVYPSNYGLNEIVEMMPRKRAALLLDRIMIALQKAVDDSKDLKLKGYYPESGPTGLQRRDQEKGKVYWRCYFNAVTCF